MTLKTKAAKQRAAQDVTDALNALERAILFNKDKLTWRQLFHNYIIFSFNGTGNVRIDTAHDIAKLPNSGHEKIQIQSWKLTLEEKARTLAHHFQRLFPGQSLTWELQPGTHDTDSRHYLYLGQRTPSAMNTRPGNHVIDTVLKRWKAPLVRLSVYLDGDDETPADTLYLFSTSQMLNQPTGVCGRISTQEVPGKSFAHAFKQFCFHNSNTSATPTPGSLNSDLIAIVSNPDTGIPAETLNKQQEALLWDFSDDKPNRLSDHIGSLATDLSNSLSRFKLEYMNVFTLNLKTGDLRYTIKDHAYADPQDIADAQPLRETAIQQATDFAESLAAYLARVHPNMQEGILTITSSQTKNTSQTSWSWQFNMDGYRDKLSSSNLLALEKAAVLLHDAKVTANRRPYVVRGHTEEWQTAVNTTSEAILIHASTPAHAWTIYTSPSNPAKSNKNTAQLFEIQTVTRQAHEEAAQAAYEAIRQAY